MTHRIALRAVALGLASLMTLFVLAGLHGLANSEAAAAAQLAHSLNAVTVQCPSAVAGA